MHESDHVTDSEIEISENEMYSNFDMDSGRPEINKDFIAKDKITKWKKKPCVSKYAKTPRKNIVKVSLGPKNYAKNIQDEVQVIQMFLTNEMVDEIIRCTNIYILQQ